MPPRTGSCGRLRRSVSTSRTGGTEVARYLHPAVHSTTLISACCDAESEWYCCCCCCCCGCCCCCCCAGCAWPCCGAMVERRGWLTAGAGRLEIWCRASWLFSRQLVRSERGGGAEVYFGRVQWTFGRLVGGFVIVARRCCSARQLAYEGGMRDLLCWSMSIKARY